MLSSHTYMEDMEKSVRSFSFADDLRSKSILITGAGGLICSTVVDMLLYLNATRDSNIQVYAAGRSKEKTMRRFKEHADNAHFHYISYDATLPFLSDIRFDFVIHGAGNANPAAYVKEPVETMQANFTGLFNLLNHVRRYPAERLLYISSSEVYGSKADASPYTEDCYYGHDILAPRACYPSAKQASETLCVAYRQEYGVQSVIVRPGHIYGPAVTEQDNRASSQFPVDIMKGHDIVMKSPGNQLRSYCYALDCATAILTVLTKGEPGNAYNISNSHSMATIREMAEAFALAGGRKVLFERPTDREQKGYSMMNHSALDSRKLEQLGWKALFDLKTGTNHTLRIMKETEKDLQL